jgi:hypothetical protein
MTVRTFDVLPSPSLISFILEYSFKGYGRDFYSKGVFGCADASSTLMIVRATPLFLHANFVYNNTYLVRLISEEHDTDKNFPREGSLLAVLLGSVLVIVLLLHPACFSTDSLSVIVVQPGTHSSGG